MAFLRAVAVLSLVLLTSTIIQSACTKGNCINQDVKQQVNKHSRGPINQNVEQFVNLVGKKSSKNAGGPNSINQNVGQVIDKTGGKGSNSDINQQVHQRVVDGDSSIDKITSQAVKNRDKSEDASSEEIIFRRHHCKGKKNSDEESTESSEEIKIHRGKHSSEITHKKHEDIHGDMSEESSEEVRITKKPKKRVQIESEEEESYEEYEDKPKTCPKRIVYRPAPRFCLKSQKKAKTYKQESEEIKYVKPFSKKIMKPKHASPESFESEEYDETTQEANEDEESPEVYVEKKKSEEYIPKQKYEKTIKSDSSEEYVSGDESKYESSQESTLKEKPQYDESEEIYEESENISKNSSEEPIGCLTCKRTKCDRKN